jgi:hypothetical protein
MARRLLPRVSEKIGGEIRRRDDSSGDRFGRLSEVCQARSTRPRYILSQEAVRKEKGPKDRCGSCEKKREGLQGEDEQDKSLGTVNGIGE